MVPPGSSAPTLSRVSFDLAAGQVLGVIGPSGAGKSTLARLLVGAWRPYAGTVRVDGADLHNWDPEARGDFMGYLPQDVELFDGSVAENIARFGDMDSEAIVTAAKRAGVHDMILRLPQGYDTPIGTGGCALSGGQRQRIGLARAVYGGPCLVILDEPNSNLDDEGESALVHAISRTEARRDHRRHHLAPPQHPRRDRPDPRPGRRDRPDVRQPGRSARPLHPSRRSDSPGGPAGHHSPAGFLT